MAVAKINDLRSLNGDELAKKLEAYDRESLEAGDNPKKARNIRKAIARIKTILNEGKSPKNEKNPKPAGKPAAKKKVKQVA